MSVSSSIDINELFLTLNLVIVLSPEWIFDHFEFDSLGRIADYFLCCSCAFLGRLLTFHFCEDRETYYIVSYIRIGISFIQLNIIVILGILSATDSKSADTPNYLFDPAHGLTFWIVTMMCFIIYTQFSRFMPDIRLPDNIPIQSKWGYAFLGDLDELERMDAYLVVSKDINININNSKSIEFWDESYGDTSITLMYKFIQDTYMKLFGADQMKSELMVRTIANM